MNTNARPYAETIAKADKILFANNGLYRLSDMRQVFSRFVPNNYGVHEIRVGFSDTLHLARWLDALPYLNALPEGVHYISRQTDEHNLITVNAVTLVDTLLEEEVNTIVRKYFT